MADPYADFSTAASAPDPYDDFSVPAADPYAEFSTAENEAPGRLRSAAGSALQGFADVVAALPKSLGIMSAQAEQRYADAPPEMRGKEFTTGGGRFTVPQGPFIRPSGEDGKPRPVSEQPFYQAGEALSRAAREAAPTNPEYAGEFFTDVLPRGAGSMAGFVTSEVFARGLGLPPGMSAATTGAAAGGVQGYEEAIAAAGGEEKAYQSFLLNAGLGTTEALPISAALGRLNKATGGQVTKILARSTAGGIEEAVQEIVQSVGSNLIARDIVKYDPGRGTFEGTVEQGGAGFIIGAALNALLGLGRGQRLTTRVPEGQVAEAGAKAPAKASVLPETTVRERGERVARPKDSPTFDVVTPTGNRVGVELEVVEASDLIASHKDDGSINPDFPGPLQPRDRTRAASQAQINDIAANLAPELLGASNSAAEGAPIIGPDNVIESGNARTLAIRRAYERGTAEEYRQFLTDHGVDVSKFRQPVLVRRRLTELDDQGRIDFAREANERTTAAYSESEQGRTDAGTLAEDVLALYRGGDITSSENREFVRRFLAELPSTEHGQFVTGEGTLSQSGKRRIENAMFSRAYGDPELLAALREDPDTNFKAIGNAMIDVAPDFAQLQAAIENRTVSPDYDIRPDIIEAVRLVRRARQQGISVGDLLAQKDAFAEPPTPETMEILRGMFHDEAFMRPRSGKKLGEILRFYAKEARQKTTGPQLFEEVSLAPNQILEQGRTGERPKAAPSDRPAPKIETIAEDTGLFGKEAELTAPVPIEETQFAGNINLDRLFTSDDVRQVLVDTAEEAGEFLGARRGVQSFEDTQRAADMIGMTGEKLAQRRKGQAFNAEEALAARQVMVRSAENVVKLAEKVRSADVSDADRAAFEEALTRHQAIQEQVAGLTAEAGRALSQFRILAKGADQAKAIQRVIQKGGGHEKIDELADALARLGDPEKVSRMVHAARKPGFWDIATELWINSLLSGPQTHAVNVMSNTLTNLFTLPETVLAAGIGKVRGNPERVYLSEASAAAFGYVQGSRDGVRLAAEAFKTEQPSDASSKLEDRFLKAIPSAVLREGQARKTLLGVPLPFTGEVKLGGHQVRLPGRFLIAQDEFFKALAQRQHINRVAVRTAAKEGLRGQAYARRVAEIVNNPSAELLQDAKGYGEYLTYTRSLGTFGRNVQDYLAKHPYGKFIVPFVRTPLNIAKFGLERTPFGAVITEVRENLSGKNGKIAQDEQIARMVLGTSIMTAVMAGVAEGLITGGGPSDPRARSQLWDAGWQPYSFKIGDNYYSYQRFEPFGIIIGLAADIGEISEALGGDEADKIGAMVMGSLSKNLTSKTFVSGISDLLLVISDPDRYGERWVQRFAGTAIPTGVAQVARTNDPTLREVRSILDAFKARSPWHSQGLFPRRNVWGQPIERGGSFGPDLMSPIYMSTESDDPVAKEALRLDMRLGLPERKIGKVELSAAQYDFLSQVTGEIAHSNAEAIIRSDAWPAMTDTQKADVLNDIVTDARKQGRQWTRLRYPEIDNENMRVKIENEMKALGEIQQQQGGR